jgi:hypothetical protein
MKPDEIRALYAREAAATEAEAAATEEDARTDPEIARALWETTIALAPVEPATAHVLSIAMGDLIIALISERVAADDAWALKASAAVIDAQHRTSRPPRTPRGKPRQAKTA